MFIGPYRVCIYGQVERSRFGSFGVEGARDNYETAGKRARV